MEQKCRSQYWCTVARQNQGEKPTPSSQYVQTSTVRYKDQHLRQERRLQFQDSELSIS